MNDPGRTGAPRLGAASAVVATAIAATAALALTAMLIATTTPADRRLASPAARTISLSSDGERCALMPDHWTPRPRRTGRATATVDPPAVTVDPVPGDVALAAFLPCALEAGRQLFEARFTPSDGAGRPGATGDSKPTVRPVSNDPGFLRTSGMDAVSCAGCHHQPAIGGSGDFVANVFVGAQFRDPPTTSVATTETSERNTVTTFGSGAIELLAREMTTSLWRTRDSALDAAQATGRDVTARLVAKGVDFGRLVARPDGSYDARQVHGVDADLVIKPFGVKGVVISLREFSTNALNHHHGMQALERFGWERTGRRDFDLDGVEREVSEGQVTALTLFQAALPAPAAATPSGATSAVVRRGRDRFLAIGCGECHRPALPLDSAIFVEPNPYNRPGNLLPADAPPGGAARLPLPVAERAGGDGEASGVYRGRDGRVYLAAFTDLKRHVICDRESPHFCNEVLRQDNVPTDQFLSAKLWDAGTSAPYGHRGDLLTLSAAILAHGAEGFPARQAFLRLAAADQQAVIHFLRSLGVRAGAPPGAARERQSFSPGGDR